MTQKPFSDPCGPSTVPPGKNHKFAIEKKPTAKELLKLKFLEINLEKASNYLAVLNCILSFEKKKRMSCGNYFGDTLSMESLIARKLLKKNFLHFLNYLRNIFLKKSGWL